MKQHLAIYFGEFFGTFLLVFIGTASIAVAALFDALVGLAQVAIVWGIGVTLAIYATRYLSCAHLNPAVSLGMVLVGRMRAYHLIPYWASQLMGGIAAGATVFVIFHEPIRAFETANSIVRGSPESVRTAMMFGEYFPNPDVSLPWFDVSMHIAMACEGLGTFILVCMVFLLTEGCNLGRPSEGSSPIFIGATVAVVIAILGPLTQVGINPARDFGPRLVSYFLGWGPVAIPGPKGGFFWVYIAAPLFGGGIAAAAFRFVLYPSMAVRNNVLICVCGPDGRDTSQIKQGNKLKANAHGD